MEKSTYTIAIIVGVIILSYFVLTKPPGELTSKEVAECIAENSVVYEQLGCHACETQQELFGENYQYLNTVDCFFEREKCSNVRATPTWVINGKAIEGVQQIDTLRELTGC